MNFDREKFANVVHYICHKAENPAVLGSVKLNKVLWYADVIHYMVDGAPITGETYVKRQLGPVPQHMPSVMTRLIDTGRVARGKVDHFGFMKNEFISLREPDISAFTPQEIARIDEAFDHVCLNHTARSISDETHGVIWELAAMGEHMPYSTVFASTEGEIDEADVAWAVKQIAGAAHQSP
jgi:hypothetical protein